ncbi:MAG: mannose-6-phosphate isomerase [Cytophagales bacterium CG18_big_fil_WC_8_21_14_2_50_42_9]|nr:MAG: mannose-6-phosphate isomerase [Cytophagales bacterium CG18_big_fil_WC_8_21_14_2_50_42_9]
MILEKVNLQEKFALFTDYWHPRVAGELNGQHVKLVKLKGEFIWHQHEHEDELFFVVAGELKIELRDKTVILKPGEFIIIPRGIEHRPVAENEVQVLLFEPASTLNTGDQRSALTRDILDNI